MKKLLLVAAIIILGSCAPRYDSNRASEIISRMHEADTLTSGAYLEAVDELEIMLAEVCDMADSLVQRGVRRADVRDSLRRNSRYMKLSQQAYELDTLVLDYMKRPYDSREVRKKYDDVLRRYNKRALALGLN
ncbi:MAG: hypothetical protein K2L21_01980 [Muribaculaceae bacterium]|nr:hypothetical protein [Muribaculaceae bacterium]